MGGLKKHGNEVGNGSGGYTPKKIADKEESDFTKNLVRM